MACTTNTRLRTCSRARELVGETLGKRATPIIAEDNAVKHRNRHHDHEKPGQESFHGVVAFAIRYIARDDQDENDDVGDFGPKLSGIRLTQPLASAP